jgi:hypothetical protein
MENFGTAPAWVYGTVHGPGYCGDSGIGGELAAGQIDVVSADHAGGLRPRLRSIGVLAD